MPLAVLMLAPGWATSAAAATADDGPWSVSVDAPAIAVDRELQAGVAAVRPTARGMAADYGLAWIRFYQDYLSTAGTVKCPMQPSCSRYSVQAIRKHGILVGVVMTADRLLHEADEKRWVKRVLAGQEVRYLDPVENNDFWWSK